MRRAALVLLALVACKSKSSTPPADRPADAAPKPAAKIDAAPAAAPLDAAPAEPLALVARDDGVGPLDGKDLPIEKLKQLLVGYDVELIPADPEDEIGEATYEVSRGEDVILEIPKGRSSITIVSSDVTSEVGAQIGDTYEKVAKAIGPLKCEDGGAYASTTEAFVFCTSKKHPAYSYNFIDMDEEGSPLRPASDLLANKKLLAGATLAELVWSAN